MHDGCCVLWPFAEGRVEQGRTSFVLLVGPYPRLIRCIAQTLALARHGALCLVSLSCLFLLSAQCGVGPALCPRLFRRGP